MNAIESSILTVCVVAEGPRYQMQRETDSGTRCDVNGSALGVSLATLLKAMIVCDCFCSLSLLI